MSKKLLIIQYRTDASREHEQQCLREDLQHMLHDYDLEFCNAVTETLPQDMSPYCGVILAGSGEFCLCEGHGEGTWKQETFALIDRILGADIPLLGICFGMQLIALHQGARIVQDPEMGETGTFRVSLTDHGRDDVLFRNMPDTFLGQFGHKDTIVDAPDHLIPLASTDRVDLSTFRVQNKHVWGVLMHPELDPNRMVFRMKLFPSYLGDADVEHAAAQLMPSPEASRVIENFVSLLA